MCLCVSWLWIIKMLCTIQFLVVLQCTRSNDNFHFPLGWIRYYSMLLHSSSSSPSADARLKMSVRSHTWSASSCIQCLFEDERSRLVCYTVDLSEDECVVDIFICHTAAPSSTSIHAVQRSLHLNVKWFIDRFTHTKISQTHQHSQRQSTEQLQEKKTGRGMGGIGVYC